MIYLSLSIALVDTHKSKSNMAVSYSEKQAVKLRLFHGYLTSIFSIALLYFKTLGSLLSN